MSASPLVLAIDDDPGILRLIRLELISQGFRVLMARGGDEGLRLFDEHKPDLVLLDVLMPGIDGLEVMRRLRERRDVPIVMLTARGADADKARGLDLGADDYLAKPFGPEELSARVRAVLRRCATAQPPGRRIEIGPLTIDLHRRLVTHEGRIVVLTRTEWMLLQQLASNPGRVMLNSELLSKVWGPEYRGDLQYLRVWVSRLRKKIEPDSSTPSVIRTFQGTGYMLAMPGTAGGEGVGDVASQAESVAVPGLTPAPAPGAPRQGSPRRRALVQVGALVHRPRNCRVIPRLATMIGAGR